MAALENADVLDRQLHLRALVARAAAALNAYRVGRHLFVSARIGVSTKSVTKALCNYAFAPRTLRQAERMASALRSMSGSVVAAPITETRMI